MSTELYLARLAEPLREAIEAKGFTELTTVQRAVLEPGLSGRDLRVSSQTGSGKTVAIGLSLRELIEQAAASVDSRASSPQQPVAVVIAPTRELAQQSQAELGWLYAKLGARVVAVTGGSGYRDELRSLARGALVVVGTPGRLLDHLTRGALPTQALRAVVLDEADRMLDLGFREDLEAIFSRLPAERQTHLVSATFPRAVEALARSVQRDPVLVEGTRLGAANDDIDHLLHLVRPHDRVGAIVNLLLLQPGARTLVFTRTRAGTAELCEALSRHGFSVSALSGELDQTARNHALAAFKEGRAQVLVATDVAARGIDVAEVVRVIHADPPTDADSYTHRAGRTGRAGRKGTSSLLVTPSGTASVARVLRLARVQARFEPLPDPAVLRQAADARVLQALTCEPGDEGGAVEQAPQDPRALSLADRILASADPRSAIARLVSLAHTGVEPTDVCSPAAQREHAGRDLSGRAGRAGKKAPVERGYVRFHVSWGGRHGAEAHRVLAMVCRRGGIAGRHVGAIAVEPNFSVVDVALDVAEAFAKRAARPDPRDRRVTIRRDRDGKPQRGSRHAGKADGTAPLRRRPKAPRAASRGSEPRAE